MWCMTCYSHTHTHSICMYIIHIATANVYTDQLHLIKLQSRILWDFFPLHWCKQQCIFGGNYHSVLNLDIFLGCTTIIKIQQLITHRTVDFILRPSSPLFHCLLVSCSHCCNSSWSIVALQPYLFSLWCWHFWRGKASNFKGSHCFGLVWLNQGNGTMYHLQGFLPSTVSSPKTSHLSMADHSWKSILWNSQTDLLQLSGGLLSRTIVTTYLYCIAGEAVLWNLFLSKPLLSPIGNVLKQWRKWL